MSRELFDEEIAFAMSVYCKLQGTGPLITLARMFGAEKITAITHVPIILKDEDLYLPPEYEVDDE